MPEYAVQCKAEIDALLTRSELFAGLWPNVRSACAARFSEVRFYAGQLIFNRGDPGDQLYVIAHGRVRVSILTPDGRELSFRHLAEADLLGEISALDGLPRSAGAVALTDVQAYSLKRAALYDLCSLYANLSGELIRWLCHQVRTTSDQLENIALYPIQIRLARFLLWALRDTQPPAPGRRIPLAFDFNQTELAQLLGASRSKVNIALGLLESAGAIRRTEDRLFCDRDMLARIVNDVSDR